MTQGPADLWLFLDVNRLARSTGWLHTPMLDYAGYGLVVFAGLVLLGWWLARRRSPRAVAAALWAGAAPLLALALNQLPVAWFHEARPYTDLPRILVLVQRSSDFSFPSDHAVLAGAVTAGLWLVSRRLAAIAVAAAVLMAFARVYIAAHYPHDVVVGLLVGAAVTLVGWWLLARPLTALVDWAATTPLRPLVAAPCRDAVREQPTGTAPRPSRGARRT